MLLMCTALLAEAKPLIQRFKLKPYEVKKGFKIWENDSLRLVVTGTGKTLASAGCSYLFALTPEYQACINIGIAAHKTLPVGTAFLAHKISEQTSVRSFYPSILFEAPCPSHPLVTVEKPQKDLSSDVCYDMESFGFCTAAGRFLPFELIHCFKIISDNQQNPFYQVTEKKVSTLIEEKISVLEDLLTKLQHLAKKHQEQTPQKIDLSLFEQWHFTVSQKHHLEDILQRLHSLSSSEGSCLEKCGSAHDVLQTLEETVKKTPLVLHEEV